MALAMQPPGGGYVPPAPTSVGGILTLQSAASMTEELRRAAQARLEAQQSQPHVVGLAGHIRDFWTKAKSAKSSVEADMVAAQRARRGEYDPAKLGELKAQGSSTIYMMLTSSKARQASSLLRDALIGTGSEKPWTITHTAEPDLPDEAIEGIVAAVAMEVEQAQALGLVVTPDQIKERLKVAREQMDHAMREEAARRMELIETRMEDQLQEGGFLDAFDEFLDDLTTFKCAFLKGPVVRRKPKMRWEGDEIVVDSDLCLRWERVSPYNIYPAPWAKGINDAPLIERHRLNRSELQAMIGVEGYSEEAIRAVLEQYGRGGLHDWLSIDSERADAEGRSSTDTGAGTGLIDALQYWGSVSGRMLREWGMSDAEVPDPDREYEVEAWLVGHYVIKAVLNPDPLGRRPYYKASYETVPGAFWGNSLYDLIRDCQDMCNAAARALANNMGIASGPQAYVNVSRLPAGEDITTMYPWKIWQVTNSVDGSSAAPVGFFQPQSNASELMAVYERYSILADEYSGIPRYMTGNEGTPGAGRTASGLSMMISNASKVIKQLVTGIDIRVLKPLIERLHLYNMRYSDDPEMKGDLRVVARGAMSLQAKEAAQVRLNELLAATSNPVDMQIIGLEGRAELLRTVAKTLNVNPDKVVPPVQVLREREVMAQVQAAQMNQAALPSPEPTPGAPAAPEPGSGQQLMNQAPVTDAFQPTPR